MLSIGKPPVPFMKRTRPAFFNVSSQLEVLLVPIISFAATIPPFRARSPTFFQFQFCANPVSFSQPMPHKYKFCFGPWNISEGQDPYGPTTRPGQTFYCKL